MEYYKIWLTTESRKRTDERRELKVLLAASDAEKFSIVCLRQREFPIVLIGEGEDAAEGNDF